MAVQEVLLNFLRDPACNQTKGRWLKRALKLTEQTEDSVVEKQLLDAVARAFTVLQSLLCQRSDHGSVLLSSRFVACVALYLHLQDWHCKESLGIWQPFCVQQQSARATNSVKRYVTSEQLGEDTNSPVFKFPRCCEHLTSSLVESWKNSGLPGEGFPKFSGMKIPCDRFGLTCL